MFIANKNFTNPFTGLPVQKGQAVLVPADRDSAELKKLIDDKTIVDSDTAIGAYGSAGTEGVHDRSQLTENDLPNGTVTNRVHDGTMASVREGRAARATAQAGRAVKAVGKGKAKK